MLSVEDKNFYNVVIRPLSVVDAQISWKWRNDFDLWKHIDNPIEKECSQATEEAFILKQISNPQSYHFAIMVNQHLVGWISLSKKQDNEPPEIDILIGDRGFWNKGIGSQAISQLLYFAKNQLNLSSVSASVNEENIGAFKMFQKLGFQSSQNGKFDLPLNLLPPPVLSVIVLVYNHSSFLEHTLMSMLVQKTNFPFEIVVGNDCSTDNSQEILDRLKENYPGILSVVFHKKNVGPKNNMISIMQKATGDFFALCDGDDYWTDPLKLQQQVDFLRNNTSYSHCWHRYEKLDEKTGVLTPDTNEKYFEKNSSGVVFNFELFSKGWELGIQTLVFRKEAFRLSFAPTYAFFRDIHLITHLLNAGDGFCLPFFGAVYRVHAGGTYSSLNELRKAQVAYGIYKELLADFAENAHIKKQYRYYINDYIKNLIANGQNNKAFMLSIEQFREGKDYLLFKHQIKTILKAWIKQ